MIYIKAGKWNILLVTDPYKHIQKSCKDVLVFFSMKKKSFKKDKHLLWSSKVVNLDLWINI